MKISIATRKKIPSVKFAIPSKRKEPLTDETHIRMAWDMVDRMKGVTEKEREEARTKILAEAKAKGIDTSGWKKKAIHDRLYNSK
jgi:Family of unknown function (DUF6582)